MSVSVNIFLLRMGICSQMIVAQAEITSPWHIYWKNPGQSGLSTSLEAPRIEQVLYPTPITFNAPGNVVNYGYSAGQTYFFAPITSKECRRYRDVVQVSWLQCTDESCVKKAVEQVPKPASFKQRAQIKQAFAELPLQIGADKMAINGEQVSIQIPLEGTYVLFPDQDLEEILQSWSQQGQQLELQLNSFPQGEGVISLESQSYFISFESHGDVQ